MADGRLSRDDWVSVALEELLRAGPRAVAVEPLARRLGTTKGSFYWHFDTRRDLLQSALQRWEKLATDDVLAEVDDAGGDAGSQVRALFAAVTALSEQHRGQLVLQAATDDPDVADALERVTARRIDAVARLLRRAGLANPVARRRAQLAYAAYLGHAQLAWSTPGVLPRTPAGRRALLAELTDRILGEPPVAVPDPGTPGRSPVDPPQPAA